MRDGYKWKAKAGVRTDKTGKYRFTVTIPKSAKYRLVWTPNNSSDKAEYALLKSKTYIFTIKK